MKRTGSLDQAEITRRGLLQLAGVGLLAGGGLSSRSREPQRMLSQRWRPAGVGNSTNIQFADISAAARRIASGISHTPCLFSPRLSKKVAAEVFVKYEILQFTGAFKERGALNKLLTLTPEQLSRGVIAASAGNHAQGLAYHAQRLGVAATIVMPTNTPNIKVTRTEDLGAKVELEGENFDEAVKYATDQAETKRLTFVHPFDDPQIIAGQGTVALEMLESVPDLEALIVPVGGGGLIAGCVIAAKSINPAIKVYGVESERYAAMYQKFHDLPIEVGGDTVAEGLAVHQVGDLTWPVVHELVDDMLIAKEESIEDAIAMLGQDIKVVVEGAGATGLAALMEQPEVFKGKRTGIILSGGNIDARILATVLFRTLVRIGRVAMFRVMVPDHPGNIAKVTNLISGAGASILDIQYNRLLGHGDPKQPEVDITVEVLNRAQAQGVVDALNAGGFETTLID